MTSRWRWELLRAHAMLRMLRERRLRKSTANDHEEAFGLLETLAAQMVPGTRTASQRPEPKHRYHSSKPVTFQGSTEECNGQKAAFLRLGEGRVSFQGLAHGLYEADAVARCLREEDHPSPGLDCRCGFHIYHRGRDASSVLHEMRGAVLLEVELYGTIVQHRYGARGSEQVVLAAWVPPVCTYCPLPTRSLSTIRSRWRLRNHPGRVIVPACRIHRDTAVELEELRNSTPVELRWMW